MSVPIHGWNSILPQLAVFFSHVQCQPAELAPLNLFLHGGPGTNKTGGGNKLAELLGLTTFIVDVGTLDDISELAGMVDLRANRESSESRMIKGKAMEAKVVTLDEFANARPHVAPQFRLLLQRKLSVYGNAENPKAKCFIGTGNLSSDMLEGRANSLDSPTTDRFARVLLWCRFWLLQTLHIM